MQHEEGIFRRKNARSPRLRWWIGGLLFLATLLSYIDRLTLSVLAPTVCRDLRLSNFQFASISVWFLCAYSVGQVVFGKLQDRIGTKVGLAIAMIVWSVAEVAQAFTRGLFSFSAMRFVLGFGEGGHWPAAIKGVAEWFPIEERGLGMGIVNTGATIGSALAPPLIVWIQLSYGWRATFIVTGAFGFVWLAMWLLSYRPLHQHAWDAAPATQGVLRRAQLLSSPRWSELIKDQKVLGIAIARFLGDPTWWLYLVWLPLYLFRARGLTIQAIGASAWIPFMCADAGALLGGWFSGWLIQRGGWDPVRARNAAIAFAAVLSPAGILVAEVKSPVEAIALISLVLFLFQFWVNNVQVLTTDLFPRELVASVSGLAGMAAGIGAMIFILSTGWIVDRLGYSPVLIASGFLLPVATIALKLLLRDGPSTGNRGAVVAAAYEQ